MHSSLCVFVVAVLVCVCMSVELEDLVVTPTLPHVTSQPPLSAAVLLVRVVPTTSRQFNLLTSLKNDHEDLKLQVKIFLASFANFLIQKKIPTWKFYWHSYSSSPSFLFRYRERLARSRVLFTSYWNILPVLSTPWIISLFRALKTRNNLTFSCSFGGILTDWTVTWTSGYLLVQCHPFVNSFPVLIFPYMCCVMMWWRRLENLTYQWATLKVCWGGMMSQTRSWCSKLCHFTSDNSLVPSPQSVEPNNAIKSNSVITLNAIINYQIVIVDRCQELEFWIESPCGTRILGFLRD